MTFYSEVQSTKRWHVISFAWLIFKQSVKLTIRTIFAPLKIRQLADDFIETYSILRDFAEHSISHHGFNLPSVSGDGPISSVSNKLSKLYEMKFASLSFGGSSGALLTLLTAVIPKIQNSRDIVLFDDVCHQSAIGGLIFGRWKAVRLVRELHSTHKTVYPLSFDTVKETVNLYGSDRIAAIILVLPSYDGFRSPSEDQKIYEYANTHGILVVVDGAWDALRFRSNAAQISPLSSICDVWISSPHKRGLTPSSLGCMLTNNQCIARLWDEAQDLGFRSSSISFADVMIAEHRLSQIISGDWNRAFNNAEQAAKLVRSRVKDVHADLYCIDPAHVKAEHSDPTHILISTDKLPDLDARAWAATLSKHFAFDVEKATASTLLLLCGSPSHLHQIELIISTLRQALNQTHNHLRKVDYDL